MDKETSDKLLTVKPLDLAGYLFAKAEVDPDKFTEQEAAAIIEAFTLAQAAIQAYLVDGLPFERIIAGFNLVAPLAHQVFPRHMIEAQFRKTERDFKGVSVN
ncbi:MAG: hypothetical protein HPY30_00140 [Gammaproteobacteria bacterium (ex Lamellibrachia satsuma)]|nr:MAG: hypothetical protein HPY30_00140 [Gammaproteobacteria bacterium (ex Lamellibrachia satsuma)]